MSNLALHIENLGKMYRIGDRQERYRTFRGAISDAATAPLRKTRALLYGQAYGAANLKKEIWALKEVSFEVQRGEVVGIIGRNGAGKSTLLKILSRITEPTTGYAAVYGRVGALLEVGTGFHHELTGRENIYLNGAILGMRRQEIDRKFDEIVDFAGVEKFIDTPVKHFSSGMGLRLGFAVAAHLEPEILVVDEVLAVGDAEFQKKCLGKMSEVAGEGRTVLFVSHNMAAIRSLCSKAFLLEAGRLTYAGEVGLVLQKYHTRSVNETIESEDSTEEVTFSHIRVNSSSDRHLDSRLPFTISFDLHLYARLSSYALYCIITDSDNQVVIHSGIESLYSGIKVEPGVYQMTINYPSLWIRPGLYALQLKLIADKVGRARYVSDTEPLDVIGNADPREIIGSLAPNVSWKVNQVSASQLRR